MLDVLWKNLSAVHRLLILIMELDKSNKSDTCVYHVFFDISLTV